MIAFAMSFLHIELFFLMVLFLADSVNIYFSSEQCLEKTSKALSSIRYMNLCVTSELDKFFW